MEGTCECAGLEFRRQEVEVPWGHQEKAAWPYMRACPLSEL